LIILTKFVKLSNIMVSDDQISPCRPRKEILLNFVLGLSGRCYQALAKASSRAPLPRYLSTTSKRKYENLSLLEDCQ
jgi:hypothetical protein